MRQELKNLKLAVNREKELPTKGKKKKGGKNVSSERAKGGKRPSADSDPGPRSSGLASSAARLTPIVPRPRRVGTPLPFLSVPVSPGGPGAMGSQPG